MKKIFIVLVIFAVVIVNSAISFASPRDRFERGVKHIFHSPEQLTDGLRTEPQKAKFAPLGYAGGAIKGTAFMGGKIVTGIIEILTCLFDRDNQANQGGAVNRPN